MCRMRLKTYLNCRAQLGLFAVALLFFCHTLSAVDVFNTAALKINTQSISIREVEMVFSDSYVLIQDKLKNGELSQANLEEAIRMAWSEALETTIQDKILDQRADSRRKEIINYYLQRARDPVVGERALEAFKRQEEYYTRRLRHDMIVAAGGEEELRSALKRRGQTMQQWEAGLSRELFRRDVLAMELGPVMVAPGQIRVFFEKHPELFSQADAWRLRRIRILKSKFTSPAVAKKAAEIARDRITNEKEFAQAAVNVSDDPDYVQDGGLLTRDGKADLPSGTFPGEEKIAEGLKSGGISDPIDNGDWFILVQRVSYRPPSIQTFEQASERAEALAFAEKLKRKKREMSDKLRGESYVEIIQKDPPASLLKDVRSDPDQFVSPKK